MAPVISVLFGAVILVYKYKKYPNDLPNWQTIINLFMLLFQLIIVIV
jgi:hypothetical protein